MRTMMLATTLTLLLLAPLAAGQEEEPQRRDVPFLQDLPILGELFAQGGEDLAATARNAREAVQRLLCRVEDDRPDAREALDGMRRAQALLDAAMKELGLEAAPRRQILCEAWFLDVDSRRETWLTPIWERLGDSPSMEWAEIAAEDVARLKSAGDVIAAPHILANEDQEAVAEVGSTNEMPVLHETGKGIYRLDVEPVWDGIRLAFTARLDGNGAIVAEAQAKVSRIVGRTPVKQGAKVIGAPRMQVAATDLRIVVAPGVAALIRLPGEDGPSSTGVLLRLHPFDENTWRPKPR